MSSTKSIVFNGVDDYINFGDVATFQKDYTDSFSISCWAKTVSTAAISTLIGKMSSSGGQPGYLMFLNASGQFEAVLRNTAVTNSLHVHTVDSRYNDGGWHHYVMTYNGSTIKLYVDGISKALTIVYNTLTSSISSPASLQAGAYDGITSPFFGSIDEIALFSEALSDSDVLALFASARPTNLLGKRALAAWWQMGETVVYPQVVDMVSGVITYPTIPDESSSGNDGTMTNMEAGNIKTAVPWSKFCQYSYYFDGTNESVTMGDVLGYEYNEDFSLSAWVYVGTGGVRTIIGKRPSSGSTQGWQLRFDSTGVVTLAIVGITDALIVNTTAIPSLYEWHHVVATWKGTSGTGYANAHIYVDGVDQALTVVKDLLSGTLISTAPLCIGAINAASNYYSGYITEVSVYSKELSASEVEWIYNAGEPRDLRLPAAPSDLAAWWRLGAAGDCPQSSWSTKTQQWVWGVLPKETTIFMDGCYGESNGTLYNIVPDDITTDTPGGISQYSCSFDGINKGMCCNVYASLWMYTFGATDCFSLSGWVKTTTTSGWLWGDGTSGANWTGYGVYLDGGRICFCRCYGFTGATKFIRRTYVTVNDGAWHHVVVRFFSTEYNNHTCEFFIDGVQVSTQLVYNQMGSSTGGGDYFSIGARNSAQEDPVAAKIDEVSVWGKFLTDADVAAIYNSGAPCDLRDISSCCLCLRGWWRMGDSYFAPGNEVNMEYSDKTAYAPGTPSYAQRSCYFDDTNDYVSVGDVSELSFEYNQPFSGSAWILPSGTASWQTIMSKAYRISTPGWVLQFYGGSGAYAPQGSIRLTFCGSTTSYGYFNVWPGTRQNRSIPFGSWLHVVFTYDGSNSATGFKWYINGERWPTFIYNNNPFTGSMLTGQPFLIGARAELTDYNGGYVDEVSIWNKTLSDAEAIEMWNGGDPTNLSNHSAAANLVGWWRMGDGPGANGTMVNLVEFDIIENSPRYPKTNSTQIDYFLMRGIDGAGDYQHWTVTGMPDFAGALAPTGPLHDITISASWSVTS